MNIVIHDYGGYAFILKLGRELAKRGHYITYIYSSSNSTTPKGNVSIGADKDNQFNITEIKLPREIQKTSFFDRWKLENLYGKLVLKELEKINPELVISANSPLDAQHKITHYCKQQSIPFVFWMQDIISAAIKSVLTSKMSMLGQIIGNYYEHIERKLLKLSDHIIVISSDFENFLYKANVERSKWTVIPNWASIDEIIPVEKNNAWSKENNLDNKFVFLYSGTLGFKHDPNILLELASYMSRYPDVKVVVNSQGQAANWLLNKIMHLLLFTVAN